MIGGMKAQVVALPGGVMPAAIRYASLQAAVKDAADFHMKDLEVYATDEPPADYGIEKEVAALAAFADSLKLPRFHLVGYSGGGFVSLAFAGTYPDRLLSLAVFEPARIPGPLGPEESALARRLKAAVTGLQGPDFMRAFTDIQVRPGAQLPPPPPGAPPPWMAKRPAGIGAMMQAFDRFEFDRERFRKCNFPVFYGYGDQTAEMVEIQAGILARLCPDITVRRFAGIHHFVPAEQIYMPEHVRALRDLWGRAL